MAFRKDRVFAGFGAALFLITSSALTIAVILSVSQNNNSSSTNILSATQSAGSDTVGSKMVGFTPLKTKLTKLQTVDLEKGSGETVATGATVTADYVGALADTGVIFDTSAAHGGAQTFPLSGVIVGWQVGIPGMKVGGTRELLIPSSLAYGAQASSSIPANSDLVFIVTVQSAKNPSKS